MASPAYGSSAVSPASAVQPGYRRPARLRRSPRATATSPTYGGQPTYGHQPGYPALPGYDDQPGNGYGYGYDSDQPGFGTQPGYPAQPGYPDQPEYPPSPGTQPAAPATEAARRDTPIAAPRTAPSGPDTTATRARPSRSPAMIRARPGRARLARPGRAAADAAEARSGRSPPTRSGPSRCWRSWPSAPSPPWPSGRPACSRPRRRRAERRRPGQRRRPTRTARSSCPTNPLTALGLATPYRLTATDPAGGPCHEADDSQAAFVQGAILNPGYRADLDLRPAGDRRGHVGGGRPGAAHDPGQRGGRALVRLQRRQPDAERGRPDDVARPRGVIGRASVRHGPFDTGICGFDFLP